MGDAAATPNGGTPSLLATAGRRAAPPTPQAGRRAAHPRPQAGRRRYRSTAGRRRYRSTAGRRRHTVFCVRCSFLLTLMYYIKTAVCRESM